MSYNTFGTRDAMRQHLPIGEDHSPEVKRKAAVTVAANVPEDEVVPILKMLGLA